MNPDITVATLEGKIFAERYQSRAFVILDAEVCLSLRYFTDPDEVVPFFRNNCVQSKVLAVFVRHNGFWRREDDLLR